MEDASALLPKLLAAGVLSIAALAALSAEDLQSQYGVTAMPTFKMLKNGKVIDSMQGADDARNAELSKLRGPWEKTLRDALSSLKTKFGDYMETLGARGEVERGGGCSRYAFHT